MSQMRTIMALVVVGCGLAALISLHQIHRGLDAGDHSSHGLVAIPSMPARTDTKELLKRLGEFPNDMRRLEKRLLQLEKSITEFAAGDGGSAPKQDSTSRTPKTSEFAPAPDASSKSTVVAPQIQTKLVSATLPPQFQDIKVDSISSPKPKWRDDHKCGKRSDDSATGCNPDGSFPCCSGLGWCGVTSEHCDCPDCVDYRQQREGDTASDAFSNSIKTIMSRGKDVSSSNSQGDKTVVVVIPFRDREGHLTKFKEYWRWFAAEGRRPKTVFRWEVYIIEQFDSDTFNRGWTFNVGLAIASAQRSASVEIDASSPINFDCAAIQDIDYLPEFGVDYGECSVPMQLSAEIDRYNWKTPYMESAGGIVSMSLKHWRKINGFGNNYFGWGGEDDELYHRLRLNGLLLGDCYPFCKEGDKNIGRTGLSIKRPPKGYGRFSGKYMHSANHTKRITDSKAYDRNLKQLEQIRKGSDRWKNDGLSNLAFRIVQTESDHADSETHGITYHHVKVHRGSSDFSLGKINLAVPATLCTSETGYTSETWILEEFGVDIPWDLAGLRARVAKQAGAEICAGAAGASFVLVDRRRNLAKLIPGENPRLLVAYYRSLHDPEHDGLIIALPGSPDSARNMFATANAFVEPPADYTVCTSKIKTGSKYSVHEGLGCGGGGWDAMGGGHFKAYAKPGKTGTKAVSWCDTKKYWTQRIVSGETCPEKWANLEWEYGGSFWAPPGDMFCVGTRENAKNSEESFSRILPKSRCGGEGFTHVLGFSGVREGEGENSQRPMIPIVVCIGKKDGKTTIVADPASCEKLASSSVFRFAGLELSSAVTSNDKIFCVVRDFSSGGDAILEGRDCSGDIASKVRFSFFIPAFGQETSGKASSQIHRRPRICFGKSASALGPLATDCPQDSFFEAPSILDIVESTPLRGQGSDGSKFPLYLVVEEAVPCFGFLCAGTLAHRS